MRIHNASIGKHHPEGSAAKALRQGKVKECDQNDDGSRRKPRMRDGKAAIGNPDKSQERRAANRDGEQIGDPYHCVSEDRRTLVSQKLSAKRLIDLPNLSLKVIERLELIVDH